MIDIIRTHTETRVGMGRTYSKNKGQIGGPIAAQSGNQAEGRDRGYDPVEDGKTT